MGPLAAAPAVVAGDRGDRGARGGRGAHQNGPLGAELILASGSPRRRELLAQLGVPFEVVAANVDETPLPAERALDLVRRLALSKASKASKAKAVAGTPVLGADTIVELDGQLLGQPVDADDARRMLRLLSARTHRVHTGVALIADGHEAVETATTLVTFVPVTPALLDWYLATGESFGKAGAYAIQGAGGVLVEKVNGSVSNVVGLPLTVTARLLIRSGVWEPRVSGAPSGPHALG